MTDDEYFIKLTAKAIQSAEKAFYNEIEKEGYDGAYWAVKITSYNLGNDFSAILNKLTWDNLPEKKKKE